MNSTASYRITSEVPAVWSLKDLLHGLAERGGIKQFLVGSIAGFFGPSIGMPGIPLTVYFSAVNMNKEVARSTTLAFFIVICIVTLGANYGAGAITPIVYETAPLLIPALLAGMVLGNIVFPHISQRWFQLILNLTIFYSSCRILYGFI